MSQPDYPQSVEDHRKVLILLKPFENLIPSQTFNKIFDAILTYHSLTPIPGHQDEEIPRSIQARFVRHHALENNAWGEFQTHRQVMGLMCVAGYRSKADLEDACRQYDSWKEQYAVTAVDGLLILVDLREPSSPPKEGIGPLPNVDRAGNCEDPEELDTSCVQQLLPYSYKDVLWLEAGDANFGVLHSRVRDFMIVVFWLLESMRLNWMQKLGKDSPKADSPSVLNLPGKRAANNSQRSSAIGASELLMAPFEKREMVGLIRDNRQYQRRQNGRHRKHIGDLSLLCGLPTCALEHYSGALERLKAANDWLWVGACLEGLCAASAVVHYGTGDPVQAALKVTNVRPSVSVEEGSKPLDPCTINVGESRLSEATRQLLDEHYMLAPEERQGGPVVEPTASVDGSGLVGGPALPKHCLTQEGILEKYKGAMEQYRKYSLASVICFEAGLKCCRLFIRQNRRLEAADFLQQVLAIKLVQPEDRAVRYAVAARLYEMMLFPRKAAFFWGLAGRARVEVASEPAFIDYLAFLKRAAPAYCLQLQDDGQAGPNDSGRGWSRVKLSHLLEMATAALKTRQWSLLVNLCSHALDIGREALTEEDLSSFLKMLAQGLAEEKANPPSVRRLQVLPQIDAVKLSPLASHLQPVHSEVANTARKMLLRTDSSSPFIYSPLLTPKKSHVRSRTKIGACIRSAGGCLDHFSDEADAFDSVWVCGEVCRLDITITNPLAHEIELAQIQLLLVPFPKPDAPPGAKVRQQLWSPCYDAKFVLGPGCFKTITLLLEPPSAGKFTLKGWRFFLFNMACEQLFPANPGPLRIQVAPRLPIVEIATDLNPVEDFVQSEEGREKLVADGTLALIRQPSGQSGKAMEFTLSFMHPASSSCDVTSLRLDFSNDLRICHDKSDYRKRTRVADLLKWSDENLAFQLPLKRGCRAAVTIYVDPSKLPEKVVSLETLLTIEYSSEEGMKEGWCRRNVVAIVSEVTAWAAVPVLAKDTFAEVPAPLLSRPGPGATPSIHITSIG